MAEDPSVTDAESQAFTAKAAELMTRHAIAEAEARAQRGEGVEEISRLDFPVSGVGGHGKARVKALAAIAAAYGCQSAVRGNTSANTDRTLIIIGTVSALDSLRVLLPSITSRWSRRRGSRRGACGNLRSGGYDRSTWPRNATATGRSSAPTDCGSGAHPEPRARLAGGCPGGVVRRGETRRARVRSWCCVRMWTGAENFPPFPELRPTGERTYHRAGYRAGYLRAVTHSWVWRPR